jgi:hypothetical protein
MISEKWRQLVGQNRELIDGSAGNGALSGDASTEILSVLRRSEGRWQESNLESPSEMPKHLSNSFISPSRWGEMRSFPHLNSHLGVCNEPHAVVNAGKASNIEIKIGFRKSMNSAPFSASANPFYLTGD